MIASILYLPCNTDRDTANISWIINVRIIHWYKLTISNILFDITEFCNQWSLFIYSVTTYDVLNLELNSLKAYM